MQLDRKAKKVLSYALRQLQANIDEGVLIDLGEVCTEGDDEAAVGGYIGDLADSIEKL